MVTPRHTHPDQDVHQVGKGSVSASLMDQYQPTGTAVSSEFDVHALTRLSELLVAVAVHRHFIIIDDVHEADRSSLEVLAWLQRRFRFSRVGTAQPWVKKRDHSTPLSSRCRCGFTGSGRSVPSTT